jgi:hypothetical protein
MKRIILLSLFLLNCGVETVQECRSKCDTQYALCSFSFFNNPDKSQLVPGILVCGTINSTCYTRCGGTRSSSSSSTR